jgi:hypothetical protein
MTLLTLRVKCHNFLHFLFSDIQDTEGTPLDVLGAHHHGEEVHQGCFSHFLYIAFFLKFLGENIVFAALFISLHNLINC